MKYIVSDPHRFVYFVTPKVACSSLKRVLLPLFPIDVEPYRFVDRFGAPRIRVHRAFDESPFQVERAAMLAADRHGGYFKFGFVRDPRDRLVSCFAQKLHPEKQVERGDGQPLLPPPDEPDRFRVGMSFAAFVEAVHRTPDEHADPHFASQWPIFHRVPEPGALLADFVGRFETLDADFDQVAARIPALAGTTLPHELKSRTRPPGPFQSFYDARTWALAAERYAADIALFGYGSVEGPC